MTLKKVNVIFKSGHKLDNLAMRGLMRACPDMWHHSNVQSEEAYKEALAGRAVPAWE